MGKTWSKVGKTPCIREFCRYTHLSAISAISESGELNFAIQDHSFCGKEVVNFLHSLLRYFGKDLLIIWDGASIHNDKNIKSFLEENKNELGQSRIHLERLPAYSPQLNAGEQVWQALKDDMLKNVVCKNLAALEEHLVAAFEELQQDAEKIRSFFNHPDVGWVRKPKLMRKRCFNTMLSKY